MPCYDGRDHVSDEYEKGKAAKVEAVLCSVVTAYGLEQVIENINLAECGVDKQSPARGRNRQEDRGGQRHTYPEQNDRAGERHPATVAALEP